MTRNQVLSSLSCSIIGTLLVTLLLIAFLVWFVLAWWMVTFAALLLLVVVTVNVNRVRRTASVIFQLNNQKLEFQSDDKFTNWFIQASPSNQAGSDDQPKDVEDPNDEDKEYIGGSVKGADVREGPTTAAPKTDVDRRKLLHRNDSTFIEGPSIGLFSVGKIRFDGSRTLIYNVYSSLLLRTLGKNTRVTEASEVLCWFMMFL